MVIKKILSKRNRALLRELVATDFKLRYQGSALGYAWSLLRPLFMFVILYVVFTRVFSLGKDVPHYPVYLLLGIVLWNFFTEMTSQSLGSIVGRGDLIRKIRIPRWTIVFSASISAFINLGLNLVIVAALMLVNHVDLMKTALLLPLVLVEVYLFALGASLFLAAAFVKYRDISYIWEVVLQGAFYLTPILYPVTKVTSLLLEKLMLLNPMAQAIQDARYLIVSHDKTVITAARVFDGGWYVLVPLIIVGLVLLGGVAYFRREAEHFAENI